MQVSSAQITPLSLPSMILEEMCHYIFNLFEYILFKINLNLSRKFINMVTNSGRNDSDYWKYIRDTVLSPRSHDIFAGIDTKIRALDT